MTSAMAIAAPATTAVSRLHLVISGHVDHGKSTVVGRLLADTGSLPEGKLEQVKALCERTSKPFEYAFLLDALRDERAQGITIDAARVFFKTPARHYVILDAPSLRPHPDCALLRPVSDAFLVVVVPGRTPRAALADALETIDRGTPAAFVLNHRDPRVPGPRPPRTR